MADRMAMYERQDNDQPSPSASPKPGKPSPLPPGKPKFLKKSHLDVFERPTCSSAPVSRTASPDDQNLIATRGGLARDAFASSENLGSSLNPQRSPVVMRRTGAVGSTRDPSFSDDELEDCTVRFSLSLSFFLSLTQTHTHTHTHTPIVNMISL